MNKIISLILILVLILIAPSYALAAWGGTDNFDSYTAGNNLNTLNGGSGWGAAWSRYNGTGNVTVETALSGGSGGKAAQDADTTASQYKRVLTANITSGTVSFEMRTSATPNNFDGVYLRDSGDNGRMYVKFDTDGNIKYFDGGLASYVTIQAFSVDTWYRVNIDFDDTAQNDKYRVRIGCGSYSAFVSTNGAYTDINNFVMDTSQTNALTFQLDDVRDGSTDCSSATPINPYNTTIFE